MVKMKPNPRYTHKSFGTGQRLINSNKTVTNRNFFNLNNRPYQNLYRAKLSCAFYLLI